jgi:hypothetical protein
MLMETNIKIMQIKNITPLKEGLFQLAIENSIELDLGYVLYLYNESVDDEMMNYNHLSLPKGFFGVIHDIDKVGDVILVDVEYDKKIKMKLEEIEKVVLYEKLPPFINI